ncbi:MAG: efflux RND transporter permease subunit [Sedimentisphaerales bacterium]|nr:efflux RND transporter permease subunit [Sedimentisphaerales bacterium]
MLTATIVGTGRSIGNTQTRFERFFARFTDAYGWSLGKVIKIRWVVIVLFVGILAGAVALMNRLGSEFLPQMDDGRSMVKVKLPTGASVGQTDHILKQIEQAIGHDEAIESLFTLVGGKVWGLYTYEIANEGEIDIQLVPRGQRNITTKQYIEKIRPLVAKVPVPGGNAMVMQMKVKGIRKLGEADIEVKIKGPELQSLYALARQTARAMAGLEHFTNIYVSMDMTKPEYHVRVDRSKAAELGVSISDISDVLRSLVTGAVAMRYREGDEYYNIRVMIPEWKIKTRQDVEELPVSAKSGGFLRIRDERPLARWR